MKINTLIIDDNLDWQKIISKLVQMNPLLNLVGVCDSAMQAYAKLVDEDIDLLICDIEMPEMSGLQFVKSLRSAPLAIFVTAHRDYALDCYEVSPVDFLLKPIDLDRFLQSIEKVRLKYLNPPEIAEIEPYFFVRENLNYVQILYKDVLYMKAQENFLQIVTTTQSFLPILSITKMEEQLKGDRFLRVHRSFLVNRSEISVIGKNEITLSNGQVIPIGDQYRSQINRKHIDGNLVSRNS
ncbi:DNA-binding response regulator [Emticicia aquatilis]|uniref:DNA-binding response regulator n=1 Tax=Emticicia aquatilis TaxID=1537369 RepID=A0A917DL99_9BACT|nr:LytTR family DNA-binding domain-containing protein [Emticicia aquatilis]GGD47109.1 DNA-binding response regulator [Emticicia aquatilis]